MRYRIRIEKEKDNSPDERGYASWDELYEQIIEDLSIMDLVSIINRPAGSRRYPTAEEFWRFMEQAK